VVSLDGSIARQSLQPQSTTFNCESRKMSMFSGLGNQISGFVAQKMGSGAPAEGEPAEGQVPVEGQGQVENGEGGEVPPEGGAMGGAMGFAQGLMMKAAAVKEGVAAKAGGLAPGNLQSMAGGVMGQVQGLIPGMKREEDVPDPAPPAEGEYQEYAEDPNQYQEEQYTE